AAEIRTRFSAAMSHMYRREVPLYGDLLALVAQVNARVRAQAGTDAAAAAEDTRLQVERHGAVRVGKPEELRLLRRLFDVMGMKPVGYYDLSGAGVPVHSTAFRPVTPGELAQNPFRVFTSLLRLELIADPALRNTAAAILATRDIFTPRLRELTAVAEQNGGLDSDEADEFVEQAMETFRWHAESVVPHDTYARLHDAHRLIADVVSFKGPHINHLTPRTLDIDQVQALMAAHGMSPKASIEGPPPRRVPILLRQTSFKALHEPIAFKGGSGGTSGTHTARFGEVEQRGIALTPKGRALYDTLLAAARDTAVSTQNQSPGLGPVFERVGKRLE
ncbi:MAG: VOC family protein, partial [Lysobacteraceae bacterium]